MLVRTHKAGENIECTVIRAAQPLKVTVTLGEKEMPELGWILASRHPLGPGLGQPFGATGSGTLYLQTAPSEKPTTVPAK